MAAVHIRNLDEDLINALKQRAVAHERSLEGELRIILREAARDFRPVDTAPLVIHTVRVGHASDFSREEMYPDDER
ncbi:MAG: FitA-like ribbon-helix-helix domain-containing protein [Polyangiales bacterium]